MSERPEEMLRIARAATKGPWLLCHHLQSEAKDKACPCGYRGGIWGADQEHIVCEMGSYAAPDEEALTPARYERPQELANAQHIARFNPRTAEALVKVAIEQQRALDHFDMASELYTNDTALAAGMATLLRASLSALTAAMEDSRNV
jgi:hypothetical protein